MSTFMDDGGESNDCVMVHSAEMVDKQSDELEILKEIPANTTKKKSLGKKLQNKCEGVILSPLPRKATSVRHHRAMISASRRSATPSSQNVRMSTFMDDGGESNDFGMVRSAEMADKQSDELEILKEIPANTTKKKSQGKKLQNESEAAIFSPLPRTTTPARHHRAATLASTRCTTPSSQNVRMSTFMDDGGESNDCVMVYSAEMVDKQSDELEILKEIPANNPKKKSLGKKLQNKCEGAILSPLPSTATPARPHRAATLASMRRATLSSQNISLSTFMADGGEYNDYVMVHSTEMVDKQSDELEILKEIPANTRKKSKGKKLQNESEGVVQVMGRNNKRRYESLSSTRLTLPPQFKRYGNRVWLEGREKRKKFMLVNKESPCNRRWEDMDHEILIQIMKRYSLYDWGGTNFVVCKSWLSAFLDFLFPPGQILDLRVLDDNESVVGEYRWRVFYRYLQLNLNRRSPDSYTTIILSKYILPDGVYENIAQRLPLLKSFVFPEKMIDLDRYVDEFTTSMIDGHHGIAYKMCPFMQNLESVVCHATMLLPFIWWCKSIRRLTLTGYDHQRGLYGMLATNIAEAFPHLEHLSISFFTISLKGLKSILNAHPKLQCLDLQHSLCIDEKINEYLPVIPLKLPWPEEIIANVKTVLTCSGNSCAKCRLYYLL